MFTMYTTNYPVVVEFSRSAQYVVFELNLGFIVGAFTFVATQV